MLNSKKFHQITLLVWSFILLLTLIVMFFLYKLDSKIEQERSDERNASALLELAYKINYYDDYLTSEARNFTVTTNLKNLQNYWEEASIKKNRDIAIENLKKNKLSAEHSQLLVEAKQNSDILIQTEARAMKLVMLANQMPEQSFPQYIVDLQLSANDQALPPIEKVKTAQNILFDNNYTKAKLEVTEPINKFKQLLKQKSEAEILSYQQKTYSIIITLYGLLSVLVLLLILMVWMKFLILKSFTNEKTATKKKTKKK